LFCFWLLPVAGDWDGDGVDTIAKYRQSDGKWFLDNTIKQDGGITKFKFGGPNFLPVTGDWDGN